MMLILSVIASEKWLLRGVQKPGILTLYFHQIQSYYPMVDSMWLFWAPGLILKA